MTGLEVLADLVAALVEGIHQAVTGLSREELIWRPDAEGNSIGVTVWHCSRGLDVLNVRFLEQQPAEAEQWHTQGWAEKTVYDPRGIGSGGLGMLSGYTQEEVAAIPVLPAAELLTYLDQVAEALRQHLRSLPESALAQPTTVGGGRQTAYQLIKEIVLGCVGHLGEIEALKAMQTRAKQRLPACANNSLDEKKEPVMSIEANGKLLLDVFSAVEQRNEQRFRELVHPEFEIHWPPSIPYGGIVRGLAPEAPTWSETWIPLQPTEAERRMDPRVVAASEDEVVVLWRQCGVTPGGDRFDGEVLGLYQVREGRLKRAQMFYFDTAALVSFLAQAARQATAPKP